MGQSTDAIIFYGYCWNEEEDLPEEAEELYSKDEQVLVGRHCSIDYPMPYIYVAGSRVIAWRGDAKQLTAGRLLKSHSWNQQLRDFCTRFKIEPPQGEPQWWLVSWWG